MLAEIYDRFRVGPASELGVTFGRNGLCDQQQLDIDLRVGSKPGILNWTSTYNGTTEVAQAMIDAVGPIGEYTQASKSNALEVLRGYVKLYQNEISEQMSRHYGADIVNLGFHHPTHKLSAVYTGIALASLPKEDAIGLLDQLEATYKSALESSRSAKTDDNSGIYQDAYQIITTDFVGKLREKILHGGSPVAVPTNDVAPKLGI